LLANFAPKSQVALSNKDELGRWSPWFGQMSDVSDAKYYQYQYNANRKYQQHSLLPLMITFDTKYISVEVVNITAPGAFIFKSVSSAR
jgi:hypothetical protein